MHQFLLYGSTAGVFPGDTSNTANAVVERDAQGNINVNGVQTPAAGFLSTGTLFLGFATYTGAATLGAQPPSVGKCNAVGAAFQLILPPATASADMLLIFIKTDSSGNAVTLKGSSSDNITVGATTANTTSLATQGAVLRLWCDGTQWWAL